MFLNNLSEEQQQAFLKIVHEFVNVDGVEPEEEALMETYCRETGLSTDDVAEQPVPQLLSLFETRRSRVSMMLELIGLGHIDQDFSENEQEYLRRFLEEFGWAESEFDILENWVLREIALMQDADELMESPQLQ